MDSLGGSIASTRARRRRRAAAALACVFLGGASAGAAVGLTYTQTPPRQYEKTFDSIGLTTTQRRATDSIMMRYACVIDSINHTIAPQVDSVRRAARQDVLEVLSDSQVTRLERAFHDDDRKHGQHHSDLRRACEHATDSTSFLGHTHFVKL